MEWIVEAETIEDLVDGPMMISKKIVRCKDCKHRWPDLDEGKMICLLERSRRADDDEWFCADGKRRNE